MFCERCFFGFLTLFFMNVCDFILPELLCCKRAILAKFRLAKAYDFLLKFVIFFVFFCFLDKKQKMFNIILQRLKRIFI